MKHLINSYLLSFMNPYLLTLNTLFMKKELRGYSYNHYYEIVRDCVQGMHQRRLNTSAVNNAAEILVKAGVISKSYKDFEELYEEVNSLIGHIKGIGKLTVYDTALKLGCIMNPRVFPRDYVYLMADAPYNAACRYYGKKLSYIEPIGTFAAEFGKIPSMFIEDFFCVMHNYINGKSSVKTVTTKDIKKKLNEYIIAI